AFLILADGNKRLAEARAHKNQREQQHQAEQSKGRPIADIRIGEADATAWEGEYARGWLQDEPLLAARIGREVERGQIEYLRKHKRHDHERDAHGSKRERTDNQREGAAGK